MREVEAYRRFKHPNIIKILDSAVVQDEGGDGKIIYLCVDRQDISFAEFQIPPPLCKRQSAGCHDLCLRHWQQDPGKTPARAVSRHMSSVRDGDLPALTVVYKQCIAIDCLLSRPAIRPLGTMMMILSWLRQYLMATRSWALKKKGSWYLMRIETSSQGEHGPTDSRRSLCHSDLRTPIRADTS